MFKSTIIHLLKEGLKVWEGSKPSVIEGHLETYINCYMFVDLLFDDYYDKCSSYQ